MKTGGIFITFEGGEGAGKTTQIKKLARFLKKRGFPVLVTREPGGTPLANRIRDILLDATNTHITPEEELFLYEVARRDHVSEVIRPALQRGDIVLCDRFADATMAYQGFGRSLPRKHIALLNHAATGGLTPRLTILLDLPVRKGLARARKRNAALDRLEREKQSFHERVRKGYLTLARKEKKRFRVFKAGRTATDIHHDILREVEKIL